MGHLAQPLPAATCTSNASLCSGAARRARAAAPTTPSLQDASALTTMRARSVTDAMARANVWGNGYAHEACQRGPLQAGMRSS